MTPVYTPHRKTGKKGSHASFKLVHSVPAQQLQTLPPRYLDPWDAIHRPRGRWLPLTSKGRAKAKEGWQTSPPCESYQVNCSVVPFSSFPVCPALKCCCLTAIQVEVGCFGWRLRVETQLLVRYRSLATIHCTLPHHRAEVEAAPQFASTLHGK